MKNLSVAITVTRGMDTLPAFQERSLLVASEGAVSRRACTSGLLHCQSWETVMYRQLSDHFRYPFKMKVAGAALLHVEVNPVRR